MTIVDTTKPLPEKKKEEVKKQPPVARKGWMKAILGVIRELLNEGHKLSDLCLNDVQPRLKVVFPEKTLPKNHFYFYKALYRRTYYPKKKRD